MEPHQERVMAERRELDDRLTRLRTFLAKGQLGTPCDDDEWGRLWRQAGFMESYRNVLDERTAAWGLGVE